MCICTFTFKKDIENERASGPGIHFFTAEALQKCNDAAAAKYYAMESPSYLDNKIFGFINKGSMEGYYPVT